MNGGGISKSVPKVKKGAGTTPSGRLTTVATGTMRQPRVGVVGQPVGIAVRFAGCDELTPLFPALG